MAPEEQISSTEGTNKTFSKEQISSTRGTRILRLRNKSRLLREQKLLPRNKQNFIQGTNFVYPENKNIASEEQISSTKRKKAPKEQISSTEGTNKTLSKEQKVLE
jgi:hypothetical protein